MVQDIQEILVYTFGPWIGWFIVGLIAGGVIIGVNEFIMGLLQALSGE